MTSNAQKLKCVFGFHKWDSGICLHCGEICNHKYESVYSYKCSKCGRSVSSLDGQGEIVAINIFNIRIPIRKHAKL